MKWNVCLCYGIFGIVWYDIVRLRYDIGTYRLAYIV